MTSTFLCGSFTAYAVQDDKALIINHNEQLSPWREERPITPQGESRGIACKPMTEPQAELSEGQLGSMTSTFLCGSFTAYALQEDKALIINKFTDG